METKRQFYVKGPRVHRPKSYPGIRRTRTNLPADMAPTKECPSCLETLSWECFGIDARRKSRLDTYCNYCRSHYWPSGKRSKRAKRKAVRVDEDASSSSHRVDEDISTSLPLTAHPANIDTPEYIVPLPDLLPLPAFTGGYSGEFPSVTEVFASVADNFTTADYDELLAELIGV